MAFVIFASVSSSATAADPFSFEGFAGLEYDGRIRVDELDLDQRKGDFLALVETKLRAKSADGGKGSLTLGYDLSQRSHFEFPDLDRQSHRFSADGRVKVSKAELAATYDYIHFRLGGEALVDIQGVEPKVSWPVARKTTLSASYRFERWDFATANTRNTKNDFVALGFSHQFSPGRQLTARLRYETNNAITPRLDLHGFQLNTAYQLPFHALQRRGSASLQYEFRKRDYESITPAIGERRWENRSVLTVTADLPFSRRLGGRTSVRLTDRNSNFPASNYEEVRASLGLVVRL
jgi:hypothetical protein